MCKTIYVSMSTRHSCSNPCTTHFFWFTEVKKNFSTEVVLVLLPLAVQYSPQRELEVKKRLSSCSCSSSSCASQRELEFQRFNSCSCSCSCCAVLPTEGAGGPRRGRRRRGRRGPGLDQPAEDPQHLHRHLLRRVRRVHGEVQAQAMAQEDLPQGLTDLDPGGIKEKKKKKLWGLKNCLFCDILVFFLKFSMQHKHTGIPCLASSQVVL